MSDTATGSTDTVKRSQKPRNVDYGLEIVEDLPDDLPASRHSPLEEALSNIIAEPKYHGKFVRIATYENGSAASASSNVLRQRHGGTAAVEGFTIRAKRFTQKGEGGAPDKELTGLFVKYDPGSIIPGAREEWTAKEKARKEAIAAKRVAEGKEPTSTVAGNRPAKTEAGTGAAESAANGEAKAGSPAPPQPAPQPATGGAGGTPAAKAGSKG